jgi:hypothetical protein
MKGLLFSCLLFPFIGIAQTAHHHTSIAPAHTFQLIIPTAKYLDMYDVLMTDSMLEVIEQKRKQNENVTLFLNLGMKVLILPKAKVEQGMRVPKIEIVHPH